MESSDDVKQAERVRSFGDYVHRLRRSREMSRPDVCAMITDEGGASRGPYWLRSIELGARTGGIKPWEVDALAAVLAESGKLSEVKNQMRQRLGWLGAD